MVYGSPGAVTRKNLAISSGTLYEFTSGAATSKTTGLGSNRFIGMAQFFDRVLLANGAATYKQYTPAGGVAAWAATSGTLPTGCKLIANWAGRVVLAGSDDDDHNWWMSKTTDHEDWDYAPATTTSQDAISGNTNRMGKCPDVINTLCVYSDDILILGCANSIYQFTGDPLIGGLLDVVTTSVGMPFGKPWVLVDGELFFLGSRGHVYRMVPGSMPENISEEALGQTLAEYNLDTHVARLSWDHRCQTLHVHLTNWTSGGGTHWCWDRRQNAWFKDVFGLAGAAPTATMTLDAEDPADRVVLLGGQDGKLRQWDLTAKDDDGSLMQSQVLIGPLQDPKGLSKFRLEELHAVLTSASDDINYSVLLGESAQQAQSASANHTGVWSAGRNTADTRRTQGHAIYLKLEDSSAADPYDANSWALEDLRMRYRLLDGPDARRF
jgi:hypothetical protein